MEPCSDGRTDPSPIDAISLIVHAQPLWNTIFPLSEWFSFYNFIERPPTRVHDNNMIHAFHVSHWNLHSTKNGPYPLQTDTANAFVEQMLSSRCFAKDMTINLFKIENMTFMDQMPFSEPVINLHEHHSFLQCHQCQCQSWFSIFHLYASFCHFREGRYEYGRWLWPEKERLFPYTILLCHTGRSTC